MAAKSTYRLFFILIIVLAAILVSSSFKQLRFVSGADEGYYFKYAVQIGDNGPFGFSGLFKEYIQEERHWVFPSPLRVGLITLSAIWLKIFGISFMNLAYLSLVLYLLFLCASYYFSKKFLGEAFGLLFIILLAFSPLQLAMARRILPESAVNLFSVLSIWSFWDFLQGKSKPKLILFIAAFSFSILIKETCVLLIFIFAVFLLAEKFIFKKEIGLKEFVSILFIPIIIVGLVYLALGCLPYLPDTIKIILNSPKTNPYAIMFGSGPWYSFLIDYLLLSPAVVILAIGFIFYYFAKWKEEGKLPGYFIFVLLANFILFSFFTKNVRYLIFLDMPMRLFSLLMLYRIAQVISPRKAILLTSLAVVLLAAIDYLNFYDLFVRGYLRSSKFSPAKSQAHHPL